MSDARARTPKLVTGQGDLRGIALSPTEGFILSRIDGASDEQEIVAMTGLSAEQIQACLAKLEAFGVVRFEAARSTTSAPAPPENGAPERARAPLPGNDAAALVEDVDLDPAIRRQILETHGALDRLDHYVLLGVDSAADKTALRRAYFELAARFHPDRYFRKKLGSFKPRMEMIFGRLTLAHETLANQDSRAEYDAYLAEQRRARGIEQLLAEAGAEAKRAEESIEREVLGRSPLAGVIASDPAGGSAPAHGPGWLPTSAPSGPVTVPSAVQPMDIAARRETLARRLLGNRRAGSSTTPAFTHIGHSPPPAPTAAEAMESLRRRYDERLALAKGAQARTYVQHAEAALAEGDAIAAANAFRVAVSLLPGDGDLASKAKDAQTKADVVLGETYARQAAYEEKTNQWAEAARSRARVCKARPNDGDAHEHAANALVKAGGNLHEAGRFAERACALEPTTARYRVALAKVYLAAGLTLNARRELDTAAQLAPHDGTIRELLKRIGSTE